MNSGMNANPSDAIGLDADELLHLAMKAMESGDQEITIAYLKRALAIAPDDGRIHYLLGAIYAEIGMHDRAVIELTRATELAPHLQTAHFQLGLLHAARGDLDSALVALQPIEALGPDHALYRFRAALIHLADEEYEAAVEALREGIARNRDFAALNGDMTRLIARAEAAIAAGAGPRSPEQPDGAVPEPAASTEEGQHVLLSRYRTGG